VKDLRYVKVSNYCYFTLVVSAVCRCTTLLSEL